METIAGWFVKSSDAKRSKGNDGNAIATTPRSDYDYQQATLSENGFTIAQRLSLGNWFLNHEVFTLHTYNYILTQGKSPSVQLMQILNNDQKLLEVLNFNMEKMGAID